MTANWKPNKGKTITMSGGITGDNKKAMNGFLLSVERKAFVIAKMAVNNPDDALELVQEAMFKLVQLYSDKPQQQWTPLFYKILQSRIRDWYRRTKVKNRVIGWFSPRSNDLIGEDPINQAKAPEHFDPARKVETDSANEKLAIAIKQLSNRQQQAFILRAWEGFNVKETAVAMNCSEGSVKTHYSRAIHSLKEIMKEWL
jgi:RNA polymerase sigma-70 factor (ECF subfamily)